MEMQEAIRLLESLNVYADLHDEVGREWRWWQGQHSHAHVPALGPGLDRIRNPPKRLVVQYADTHMEILPLAHVAPDHYDRRDAELKIDVPGHGPAGQAFLVYMLGRGATAEQQDAALGVPRQIKVDPIRPDRSARLRSGKPWLVITGVRIGESAGAQRTGDRLLRDRAEWTGATTRARSGKNATLAPLVHWEVSGLGGCAGGHPRLRRVEHQPAGRRHGGDGQRINTRTAALAARSRPGHGLRPWWPCRSGPPLAPP